jgi:hypothetical protein
MYSKQAFAACCISVFAASSVVAEDITVVSKIISPMSGTLTLHLSSHDVRYTAGARDWLYSETNGKLIAIDHAAKTYYEWTAEERDALRRLEQEKKERDEQHRVDAERVMEEQLEAAGKPPLLGTPSGKMIEKNAADFRANGSKAETLHAQIEAIIGPTTMQNPAGTRLLADHECELLVIKNNLSRIEVCFARDMQSPVFGAFANALYDDSWLDLADPLVGREVSTMKDKGLPLKRAILPGDAAGAGGKNGRVPTAPAELPAPRNVSFQSLSWEAVRVDKGHIDPSVFAFTIPASYRRLVSPIASRTKSAELLKELDSVSLLPRPGGQQLSGQETGRRIQRILELADLLTQDTDAIRDGRGTSIGVAGDSPH